MKLVSGAIFKVNSIPSSSYTNVESMPPNSGAVVDVGDNGGVLIMLQLASGLGIVNTCVYIVYFACVFCVRIYYRLLLIQRKSRIVGRRSLTNIIPDLSQ